MDFNSGYKPFICAGAVILVANDLSESNTRDILDALLYAQTAAANNVTDFSQTASWTNAHKIAMRVTGAMLLDDPDASLPAPMHDSFSLIELVQKVLRNWPLGTAASVLDSTGQSRLDLRFSTPAIETLQQHVVHQGRWVRFMFSLISADLTITTVMIAFEFDEVMGGNVLQHRFNTEKVLGNLSVDGYRAQADPEDYEFSRATIISLLGELRNEHIIALA